MMAHTRITIDNNVVLNSDLGDWQQQPPDFVQAQLRPGAKPQPWMKALLVTMAEAAATDQPLTANITTRAGGWTLAVDNNVLLVR